MRDLKIGMHTLKILSWLTYHAYQDQRVNTERYGEKLDMKTYSNMQRKSQICKDIGNRKNRIRVGSEKVQI